jgi:NADP-dependent 3-hydroxy acid dehydrogenase YdfG
MGMDLQDSDALVTGASTGIGAATAEMLASEGARVAITARRENKLQAVAERIKANGGEAVVIPADITDQAQVEPLVDITHRQFDSLDVLVNSAGVLHCELVANADPGQWQREISVNLFGLMNTTRVAVTAMLEQGAGHIVNVSSMNARKFPLGGSGYSASKAGVNAFTETLRQEVTEEGIRTTVIEPGLVDTAMQDEETREAMRLLDPADVADTIVYVVSRPEHVNVNNILLRPTEQQY